ncbi:MAG: hypothetical protein CM15mP92_2360 [Halieaceae bacterium]|nr:MAG: hypothetical protein CM15mP92_2360 [Halieaceae bacterium]
MLTSRLMRKRRGAAAKMAKQRGKVKMFDRGGDIAELKKLARRKRADAPRQPEFRPGRSSSSSSNPKQGANQNGAWLSRSNVF